VWGAVERPEARLRWPVSRGAHKAPPGRGPGRPAQRLGHAGACRAGDRLSRERTPRRPAPLPGFPERALQLPAGCVLTSDEIIALVVAADERKRRGESWITAEDAGPACFTVKVPKSATITQPEAIVVLSRVNEAREYLYADLLLTFQDAVIVKNHLTIKDRWLGRGIAVGGRPVSREF
jgi:hypothetical protein